MKISTVSFLALSAQANAHIARQLLNCPAPGTGMACPETMDPVKCGTGHHCVYDNDCLANAAGFVDCLPVNPSPDLCNPTTGANCPPPPVNPPTPPPCNPTTGANGPKSSPTTATASASASAFSATTYGSCPIPGSGMACSTVKDPVKCGTNYQCVYDNDCLANAAGFVGCLPVHEECPIPGTGMSCPDVLDPVKCGTNYNCVYDNHCLANAAGFVGCLPVNPPDVPPPCNPTTGANCPPPHVPPPTPPPCNPTTGANCPTAKASANTATASASAASQSDVCPVPGTGMSCPDAIVPVACGSGYKCIYDNECLANAAGFVGCLPMEESCPTPGSGMSCPEVIDPVKCGTNHHCVYDNHCLANAAGFVGCLPVNPPTDVPPPCNPTTGANCPPPHVPPTPPPCNPTTGANCPTAKAASANAATASSATTTMTTSASAASNSEVCPVPGTGMSCPDVVVPVACGSGYKCIYDNECLANAAGFVGCLPVEESCPTPGSGMSCPEIFDPVKCGSGYHCVYDNECLANSAGFVGCLPVNPPTDVPPPCNPTTGANCPPPHVPPTPPPCNPTTGANCHRLLRRRQ